MLSFLYSLFVYSAWLLMCIGIAQATPIIDQQHNPDGNFAALAVANDRTQVQTFTVGISGLLTRIDVKIIKYINTTEDLVLSLFSTDSSGLPMNLLATVSVPESAVNFEVFEDGVESGFSFVTFDLSTQSVNVNARDILAIVMNSPAPNNQPFLERYVWEIGEEYGGGAAYTKISDDYFEQSEDLHFRTYVDPNLNQCTPPNSIFADNTGTFGLVEGSVIDQRNEGGLLVTEIEVKNFLSLWLDINYINIRPKNSVELIPEFGGSLLYDSLGVLPPHGAIRYTASFCKQQGEVMFSSFMNQKAAFLTAMDFLLVALSAATGSPLPSPDTFAAIIEDVDDISKKLKDLKKTASELKKIISSRNLTQIAKIPVRLIKIGKHLFDLSRDEEQKRILTELFKKMGVSISKESLENILTGAAVIELFSKLADEIVLGIATGGNDMIITFRR